LNLSPYPGALRQRALAGATRGKKSRGMLAKREKDFWILFGEALRRRGVAGAARGRRGLRAFVKDGTIF